MSASLIPRAAGTFAAATERQAPDAPPLSLGTSEPADTPPQRDIDYLTVAERTKDMDAPRNDMEIATIIERLEKEFPNVPPPEVEAVTLEAHDAFNGYPVGNSVPTVVERQAKERLRGR